MTNLQVVPYYWRTLKKCYLIIPMNTYLAKASDRDGNERDFVFLNRIFLYLCCSSVSLSPRLDFELLLRPRHREN